MTDLPRSDHKLLSRFEQPELPTQTHELFHLFASSPSHSIRICSLAKIKQQLMCSVHDFVSQPPSPDTSQAVQVLVSRTALNFISKTRKDFGSKASNCQIEEKNAQSSLFYHVIGLSVKYYFREDAIKGLLGEVTELLQGHPERVKPALFLFTEIICTIENQPSNRSSKTTQPRCLFERHLFNEHINSMLALGNYCVQRGVLPDGLTLQDSPTQDLFNILASQDTLTAALRLVRVCLCFDWQGDKNLFFEEEDDARLLLIPIKKGRFSGGDNQFEKWLKNTDWVNLYQFLFREAQSKELKIEAIQIIGDLARAHLRFFKSKPNYRMYIEGIVHAFTMMLEDLSIYRSRQQTIEAALALGINLNKLLNSSTRSVLFEINSNLIKGLLGAVKTFIIQQIIGQQVFNTNIIFYFFKFLQGVLTRSRFERNKAAFDVVDQLLREICRSYEHYIRVLFNGIRRTPIRHSESFQYRKDYSRLKDAIMDYDWKQMALYFLPFKLMKPRYYSTNTVYELFIHLCARVARSVSLLEMFKMQPWQLQVAYQMITQAISKIGERFALTSYKKPREKREIQNQSQSNGDLPSIDEQFGEEIENEEEYCHMLRLCLFLIMDELADKPPTFLLKLSSPTVQAIRLSIQLCFCADLQDTDSPEGKKVQVQRKLFQGLSLCPVLLRSVLQRQYDKKLFELSQKDNFKTNSVRYRSSFLEYDLTYVDFDLQNENIGLMELLGKVIPSEWQQMSSIVIEMITLLTFSLPEQFAQSDHLLLNSIDSCLVSIETLASVDVLIQLIMSQDKRLIQYLRRVIQWIETRACEGHDVLPTIKILRKIAEMKAGEVSQEALNKLFVALKFLLPSLKQSLPRDQQFIFEMERIVQSLLSAREADLEHLSQDIRQLIVSDHTKPEPMDIEETCLNISLKDEPVPVTCSQHNFEQSVEQQIFQAPEKSYEETIYAGYHRDKTMSLLEKYAQPEENKNGQQNQHVQEENVKTEAIPDNDQEVIAFEPVTAEEVQNVSQNESQPIRSDDPLPFIESQARSEIGSPQHASTPNKPPQERSQNSQSNRQLLLVSSQSSSQKKKSPKNDN